MVPQVLLRKHNSDHIYPWHRNHTTKTLEPLNVAFKALFSLAPICPGGCAPTLQHLRCASLWEMSVLPVSSSLRAQLEGRLLLEAFSYDLRVELTASALPYLSMFIKLVILSLFLANDKLLEDRTCLSRGISWHFAQFYFAPSLGVQYILVKRRLT